MADPDPISSLPEDPIRLFLADRDAPCPGCNYNLRGIQDSACPECGRAVELTLSRPSRSRGYLLFVLLALGWVLTAGTMNGIRAWNRVRAEAAPPIQRVMAITSLRMSTGRGGGTQTFSSSGRSVFTLNSSGGVTVTTSPGITLPGVTFAQTSSTWGNVSRDTWVNFGWWSGLGLLALTTLIVVLILRRRFANDAPPWRFVAAAAALFALYAGYHALAFSREFIL
jgi:hypothetical protein